MSGFVSSGFSVGTKGYGGVAGRTAIMAIVGETASEIGGGKFANGAMGSAFQYLFNDSLEDWANYKDPDKIAFGNRNTQWHKENSDIAISMMKAGAITVGVGVAIEATYTYMYLNPEAAVITMEVIDSYLPGIPISSKAGISGFVADKIYPYYDFFK